MSYVAFAHNSQQLAKRFGRREEAREEEEEKKDIGTLRCVALTQRTLRPWISWLAVKSVQHVNTMPRRRGYYLLWEFHGLLYV